MTEGEHSQGCVFILYSIDSKLNFATAISKGDLSEMADFKLCSPKDDIYSRFGFSLVTSSNDEGNFEIYIGAPTLGIQNLTYQGVVYYYESYLNENGIVTFSVIFCLALYCFKLYILLSHYDKLKGNIIAVI